MQKCHRLFTLVLLFAIATRSLYSQPCYEQTDCCDCEAYTESVSTTHWSVYIPIALMVAAIIWFGVADGSSSGDCSGSKDGLGSIRSKARLHSHSKSYGSSGSSHSHRHHHR